MLKGIPIVMLMLFDLVTFVLTGISLVSFAVIDYHFCVDSVFIIFVLTVI